MSETADGTTRSVDLGQVSVPRLVFALLHQRFTGTLSLPQPGLDGPPRTVWFRGGMPVYTDWYEPTDMLGQILIAARLLTDAELYPALAQASANGQALGQTLLAMGRITAEQLTEALRRQCSRKLAHLFPLRGGTVKVELGEHDVGNNDGLAKLNVLELIHAAVGKYYEEERIEAEMGAALAGPVRATAALQKYASHFRFRPSDTEILNAIARGIDLETLANTNGITRKRAAQVIYTLWACQMLHVGTAAGTVPEGSAEAPAAPRPSRPRSSTEADMPARAAPAAAVPPVRTAPPSAASSVPETTEDEEVPKLRPRAGTVPSIAAGDPANEAEFVAELEIFEKLLGERVHAFRLFDLATSAGKKELRAAWGDLSRKFHPDALKAKGLDHLRDRVGHLFAALSEAHQLLSDATKRDKLRQQVDSGDFGRPEVDESAKVRAALQADLISRDADKLLRNNHFELALKKFQEASQLSPDEPDTQAALVWCEFQVSERTNREAMRANHELDAILHQWPNTARAHYFRGFVLMALGHDPIAIECFKQAHALEPRLIDAQRQARALAAKTNAASQPKGKRTGLRGLFGKK
jgi:curved DNA-binding protein CbpA